MYIFVVLGQAPQDSSRAAWAWICQIELSLVKPDQETLGVTPGQAQVQQAYGAPWGSFATPLAKNKWQGAIRFAMLVALDGAQGTLAGATG